MTIQGRTLEQLFEVLFEDESIEEKFWDWYTARDKSQNSGKPLVSGWRDFRGQKPNNGDQVLIKDPSLVQGDRWVTEWDDESIGFYLTYELLWMPLPA